MWGPAWSQPETTNPFRVSPIAWESHSDNRGGGGLLIGETFRTGPSIQQRQQSPNSSLWSGSKDPLILAFQSTKGHWESHICTPLVLLQPVASWFCLPSRLCMQRSGQGAVVTAFPMLCGRTKSGGGAKEPLQCCSHLQFGDS